MWDDVEQPGIAALEKAGGQLIRISAEAQKAFDEKAEAVVQRWIAETKAKGIDAEALVKAAREAVARHSH